MLIARSPEALPRHQQPDAGLGVVDLAGVDALEHLGQRQPRHRHRLLLHALAVVGHVAQVAGQVHPVELVGEPRRVVEGDEELPSLGREADLLGQLALGARHRILAVDVELARRELDKDRVERGAVLADDDGAVVVVDGDDRDRAGVVDDVALERGAVRRLERADGHLDQVAAVDHPLVPLAEDLRRSAAGVPPPRRRW